MASSRSWRSIPCKVNQVRLDIILTAGQSFRWRQTGAKEWTSVLKGKVWTLTQDEQYIFYRVYEPQKIFEETKKSGKKSSKKSSQIPHNHSTTETLVPEEENDLILRDYFQLDVDLSKLYSKWSSVDPYFSTISKVFPGVRTLRQDPTENLFSFICSSNNNISRITGMVEKLCVLYGEKVTEVNGIEYFGFPDVSALANPKVEQQLRAHGFGYRAKYIQQSAKVILEKGKDWLVGLRDVGYEDAHKALCELPGVGSKVADCVCLMSLDKTNAIPVDTHVWQITDKYYMKNLSKTKSLTDKLYKQIGDYYRELFGDFAGWAQFVLFSADLKKFQNMQACNDAQICQKRSSSVEPEVQNMKMAKKQ